jgi:hypothetical protein
MFGRPFIVAAGDAVDSASYDKTATALAKSCKQVIAVALAIHDMNTANVFAELRFGSHALSQPTR